MRKCRIGAIISKMTYDKCFFQKTILKYYCCLEEIAQILEEKTKKK